ncbi:Putative polypeptide N-acetylgalactosaminyltransferase 11 (pp-GaNTase 11) (Protein-UDP acetylgalactosaminyltransferase 11) (UDP-GalNAc:polypeptide N-acetylgalactosaminyltransferase 11) [Durusdinium trenchii]|uniref:Polypeptide N-acetylgalactosaminyltransferase 11 (Pp-GaNTase 11) (Protein-UDP acetylgalactosaminyltransferase 11) (UDP-GalNAc:polypeptide N-acetylgalactosaminyltransferase 11) n=1 Tax=Durusdinium trenchii TaxID=1381693 RepID=A0ABP0K0I5_9DINO
MAQLLLRVLLLWAAKITGFIELLLLRLGLALSSAASIFDLYHWLTLSPKRRSSGTALKYFLIRWAVLCILQIWSLLLQESIKPDPVKPLEPVQHDQASLAPAMRGSKAYINQLESPQIPEPQAVHEPPSIPRASLAYVGEGNFVLDAEPEDLKWSPRTISVVLPCAEERDLAFKTVKSVYDTTPPEALHEIVVVDDGSNPPLSATHLNEDVQKKFKVLIKRHEQTVGLIGAKKTGGDAATGDVIVFFDCHVAPQPKWHLDFLGLIGENYRRMVIPQITALDIDTWTQIGSGGGMSKCYLTWDGDFKWGGTDDMYMGMLSGGLAGMSRFWWDESGGFDAKMLGWGGENIDQGVRMWVCGGEIVAAPHAQVAHMWRTHSKKTAARYKHVGDTIFNRARAIHAWLQEFSDKLDDYPAFANRKAHGGPNWYGDMTTFENVRKRLNGCRPFAWYLKRFKAVYEDAGLIPPEIFMIREEQSGLCLRFLGPAGTSGQGTEGVQLEQCDESNHRFFWHVGNRDRKSKKCCSGLRAWNTDQCLQGGQGGGRAVTSICELSGAHSAQTWSLTSDGQLKRGSSCLGPDNQQQPGIKEAPCVSFRSKGGARFSKVSATMPIETQLYRKAQRDHPEVFARLNAESAASPESPLPARCKERGRSCWKLFWSGGTQCLDSDAQFVDAQGDCAFFIYENSQLKQAESMACLDTWSDEDINTWGLYECHSGDNQKFTEGPKFCTAVEISEPQCFQGQKM